MFEISDLKLKKLPELQEIAKGLDVPKYKTQKKLDLVYQILDVQAANPKAAKVVATSNTDESVIKPKPRPRKRVEKEIKKEIKKEIAPTASTSPTSITDATVKTESNITKAKTPKKQLQHLDRVRGLNKILERH